MSIHELEKEVRREYSLDSIKSIDDLEDTVREIGIPLVDFSGTDLNVGIAVAEAIGAMFKKYPALKNTICAIGNTDSINFHLNILSTEVKENDKIEGNVHYKEYLECPNTWIRNCSADNGYRIIYYAFILGNEYKNYSYDELVKDIEKSALNLFHPPHLKTIQSLIYHEFGHVFDKLLNISTNDKIINIFEQKIQDVGSQISRYANKQDSKNNIVIEIIAEAFAEYTMSPETANEAVRLIGELIEKEYSLNENNSIFNINYYLGQNAINNRKRK